MIADFFSSLFDIYFFSQKIAFSAFRPGMANPRAKEKFLLQCFFNILLFVQFFFQMRPTE
jgi:hypothetical protein